MEQVRRSSSRLGGRLAASLTLASAIAACEPGGEREAPAPAAGPALAGGGREAPGIEARGGAEHLSPEGTGAPATLIHPGWMPTGAMMASRQDHTATLLLDGRALVAGGYQSGVSLASAEIYDPVTGGWLPAAPMLSARANHRATLLPSGKVLVATSGAGLNAEVYDPAADQWTATGPMLARRSGSAVVLLPNGKVLVAGGTFTTEGSSVGAEIYDAATGTWALAPGFQNMSPLPGPYSTYGTEAPTTALLPDGRALVVGGRELMSDTTPRPPPGLPRPRCSRRAWATRRRGSRMGPSSWSAAGALRPRRSRAPSGTTL